MLANRISGQIVYALVPATQLLLFVSVASSSGVVDQSHPLTGLALGQAITSSRHFAQTFTADRAGLLSNVDLRWTKSAMISGNVLVGIRKTGSTGVPGATSSDLLYETTVPANSIVSSGSFTVSVDLSPGGVLVNRGDVLAITARRTTSAEEIFFPSGNPPYDGGAFYSRTNLTNAWTLFGNSDAGFQTWVDSSVTRTTRTISATFDATAEFSGGGAPTLTSNDYAIAAERSTAFNSDRRAILEFPLSWLPANAVIHSAKLEVEVASILVSDPIFPMVSLHGYAGDGVLNAADASVPDNLIGNSGPIREPEALSIALDAEYIQSLLGQSTHLGLLAKGDVDGFGAHFWSNEFPTVASRPRLVLDYELGLPNTGDYDGNGAVDAADYTQWRDTRGQAVAAGMGADGNGNGTIDAADYAFWKSRFGLAIGAGGAGGAQVPETAGAWLVALAAVAICGYGRKRSG